MNDKHLPKQFGHKLDQYFFLEVEVTRFELCKIVDEITDPVNLLFTIPISYLLSFVSFCECM